MDGLLDGERLAGLEVAYTALRPERLARPIDGSRIEALRETVLRLSQVWGGAASPLLPVSDGRLPIAYQRLMHSSNVEGYTEMVGLDPGSVGVEGPWVPSDFPAVALVPNQGKLFPRLRITTLAEDDPWRDIYAVTLGTMPDQLDHALLRQHNFRKDLVYEDFLSVQKLTIDCGSLENLTAALRDRRIVHPKHLTLLKLPSGGLVPDASYAGPQALIPDDKEARRAAGPNIVVLVQPGNVADLALLWNLRAAHGQQRAMPVGLPLEQFDERLGRWLQQDGVVIPFGLAGGRTFVTSASMPTEELRLRCAPFERLHVANWTDLIDFGHAPARRREQITSWHDGRTTLQATSERDLEELAPVWSSGSYVRFVLDIALKRHPLPVDRTLRGEYGRPQYPAGVAQIGFSRMDARSTVRVQWPTTWLAAEACAQSRGLVLERSEPGLAAATLLEALGGISETWKLCHSPLVQLLYRSAERTGMSWMKNRLRDLREELRNGPGAGLIDLELRKLAGPDGTSPAGEGKAIPFDAFKVALGNSQQAAENWVSWAEEKRLLVRGVNVSCPPCGTDAWLPFRAVFPSVTCVGCGRSIARPFRPDLMRFTYRIGEVLRRTIEHDALGHVLALAWVKQIFGSQVVIGSFPGVNVVDATDGVRIGEADVLVLLSSGGLVPIEVKRSFTGVTVEALDALSKLSDALSSPLDLFAVMEPVEKAPAGLASDLAAGERRRRHVLTSDHLYDPWPVWQLGFNPFSWNSEERGGHFAPLQGIIPALSELHVTERWDGLRSQVLDRPN